MLNVTSVDTLQNSIAILKSRRREQEQQLANQFMILYEGLKPFNIVKTIVHDLATPAEGQHGLLNAAMGIASGYVARKLFVGSRAGPMKKILGAALQLGITTLLGKKGDAIKKGGLQLFRTVVHRNGNGALRERKNALL